MKLTEWERHELAELEAALAEEDSWFVGQFESWQQLPAPVPRPGPRFLRWLGRRHPRETGQGDEPG